jgi:hypothetical protein
MCARCLLLLLVTTMRVMRPRDHTWLPWHPKALLLLLLHLHLLLMLLLLLLRWRQLLWTLVLLHLLWMLLLWLLALWPWEAGG